MGKEKIKTKLEDLIKAKNGEGLNFLFVTDPMHANTFESKHSKLKTRSLDDIFSEISNYEFSQDSLRRKCKSTIYPKDTVWNLHIKM